ncbi:MAG: hypothetical protein M1820_010634 [Bogoriella megaspora]|nr:MAG: hypothetical protein M1820_010634 [Bogoriella megaspora]
MLSLRVSRQAFARIARQHVVLSRRTIITPTAVRQADLVQDMYLRELKSYKVPPVKPNDADGHVQKFTAPGAPQSPEESDIAKDLQAYEQQQVEIEGQSNPTDGAPAVEQDWLEEEEDEAAPAH